MSVYLRRKVQLVVEWGWTPSAVAQTIGAHTLPGLGKCPRGKTELSATELSKSAVPPTSRAPEKTRKGMTKGQGAVPDLFVNNLLVQFCPQLSAEFVYPKNNPPPKKSGCVAKIESINAPVSGSKRRIS
jgi:hypothetical protein